MQSTFTLAIRLVVLVMFVVAMPVLSIPRVNRWADSLIFGGFAPAAAAPWSEQVVVQPDASQRNRTLAVHPANASQSNRVAALLSAAVRSVYHY